MSIKITEALFIREGYEKKVITPLDMDKQKYKDIYRGYLFCPHPGCTAHLVHVSGDVQVSHFRTWRKSNNPEENIKSKHIVGCPNSIEQSESDKQRRKNDPNFKYRLSDEHISAVLKRAYDAFLKGNHPNLSGDSKNKGNNGSGIPSDLPPTGTAALFGEGEEITHGREPRIPVRFVENIDEKDYVQVRCIIGEISNMQIKEDYAYINLKSKSGMRIKIHFNESFVVNNKPQFGQSVICCCIGEVTKVESGINIRPDRYVAFSINNKKLYAIYHHLHGFDI
ncbi:hypothetical protein [Cohnella panacarvi]|uniref:hypothetical protein n=1 Tax=Cohnella panacarvi TaxID=400776 RepID=UPI00047CD58A|nr:hypothetical protein [Cohnella panacarvi]